MKFVIKVRPTEAVISAGLNNIKRHFRIIGNKAGWHQYLGSEKIGNIATSQALLLLDEFHADFNKKYLAVKSITEAQVIDINDATRDGGWAYVTNFSSMPSSEATCWALLALYKENRNSDAVKFGINWLFQNQVEGSQDEGWGTIKTDTSRVYTTCLVLKTLKIFSYEHNSQFERGVSYLIKSQNSDGGWGEKFGFSSSITHTAHAIICLSDLPRLADSQIIKNGIDWLLRNFVPEENSVLKNGGYQEIVEFDCISGGLKNHQRLIYYHMPIPYALIALIKTGNISNKSVFWGFGHLIRKNNDGYWSHPHLGDSRVKPLWAIYDVLMAFQELKKNTGGWIGLIWIKLDKGKIALIKEGSPFNGRIFIEKFIKGIWGKVLVVISLCVIFSYLIDLFPYLEGKRYMEIILIPLVAELLGYYLTEIYNRD